MGDLDWVGLWFGVVVAVIGWVAIAGKQAAKMI